MHLHISCFSFRTARLWTPGTCNCSATTRPPPPTQPSTLDWTRDNVTTVSGQPSPQFFQNKCLCFSFIYLLSLLKIRGTPDFSPILVSQMTVPTSPNWGFRCFPASTLDGHKWCANADPTRGYWYIIRLWKYQRKHENDKVHFKLNWGSWNWVVSI